MWKPDSHVFCSLVSLQHAYYTMLHISAETSNARQLSSSVSLRHTYQLTMYTLAAYFATVFNDQFLQAFRDAEKPKWQTWNVLTCHHSDDVPRQPTFSIRTQRGRHWSQFGPVTPGRHWHDPVTGSQVTAPSLMHWHAATNTNTTSVIVHHRLMTDLTCQLSQHSSHSAWPSLPAETGSKRANHATQYSSIYHTLSSYVR